MAGFKPRHYQIAAANVDRDPFDTYFNIFRGPKKGNPGRKLTDEDITHYQRIIIAINETIRLMKEIDDVIDQHGGFPAAFA